MPDERRLDALDDAALMQRVAEGDAAAFEVLYDRYAAPAYALARRVCGATCADDAVQEAFLGLWRSGERYDPGRGSVRAFLLRIVYRRALDAVTRGGAAQRAQLTGGDEIDQLCSADRTDDEADRRADVAAVRGALAALPHAQRDVVGLAFYCGLTHYEIATALHVPVGTVKGRMRLALKRLATELRLALV
jgi:RNA polymerase sigma-70 factor (ECF subfamily)